MRLIELRNFRHILNEIMKKLPIHLFAEGSSYLKTWNVYSLKASVTWIYEMWLSNKNLLERNYEKNHQSLSFSEGSSYLNTWNLYSLKDQFTLFIWNVYSLKAPLEFVKCDYLKKTYSECVFQFPLLLVASFVRCSTHIRHNLYKLLESEVTVTYNPNSRDVRFRSEKWASNLFSQLSEPFQEIWTYRFRFTQLSNSNRETKMSIRRSDLV